MIELTARAEVRRAASSSTTPERMASPAALLAVRFGEGFFFTDDAVTQWPKDYGS